MQLAIIVVISLFFLLFPVYHDIGGASSFPYQKEDSKFPGNSAVIGRMQTYSIKGKETLLDIARHFDLGYNEISDFYRGVDPWLPPRGKTYLIPTLWIIPPSKYKQIVINIPELRLYYFSQKEGKIYTFPLGIGDEGWETPVGVARIIEKRVHPTWYIPRCLWGKYEVKSIPPGPENPLGDFWMGLSIRGYGIHGTNSPWGVGRLVSHGCIRLYPEDIKKLFSKVAIGTRVEIIYEPIKVGRSHGQVYMEVHPDVYGRFTDFAEYAWQKLLDLGAVSSVDQKLFQLAIKEQNGVPMRISISSSVEEDQTLSPVDAFFKNDVDF